MTAEGPRIVVIGAGAIGGFYGAMMASAGADVSFVARGATLASIAEHGLRIVGRREITVRPVVTDDPSTLGQVDIVLVCTKTFQVADAVRTYLPTLIGPHTLVVTTQNGVSTPDLVASLVGPEHTAAGICREWVKIVEPGVIEDMGGPCSLLVGALDGSAHPHVDALRAALERAGVDSPRVDDVTTQIWAKALNVCAQGAVGAALEADLGRLLEHHRDLLARCIDEWIRVGRAHGAHLPEDTLDGVLTYLATQDPRSTTSFQRDITSGRASELDAQIGALPSLGDAVGVDTPVNDVLAAVLAERARRDAVRA